MMNMYKRLRPFLTSEEYEKVVEDSMELENDLKFFQMYINRNQKSKFKIYLKFQAVMAGNFFEAVDIGDYSINKLEKTIAEYKILSKLFYQLEYEEETPYSEDDMVELYDYFEDEYEIKLEDIGDSFIGSSYLCAVASQKLSEIKKKWLSRCYQNATQNA